MKKVLLSSDCNGNLQLLFNKVSQLNQKNNFDLMFLVGNVCTIKSAKQFSMVVNQEIKVPIQTYFINDSPMSKVFNLVYPDGAQIAPNFHFLGKAGVKNIQGLNVCYFDGVSSEQKYSSSNHKNRNCNQADVKDILQRCKDKKIDILLTNQWPSQIVNTGSQTVQNFSLHSKHSRLSSQLSYNLSPKYHLSSSGKAFYRMQPFKNKRDSYTHFINVAQIVENNLKDKYLLAIQTIPEQLNPPAQTILKSAASPFDPKNYQAGSIEGQSPDTNKVSGDNTYSVDKQGKFGFKQSLKMKQGRKQHAQTTINADSYVFFDGVPFQARSDDVQEFLQRWGRVIKLQIFKQHKGGLKSGIAKFQTPDQTKNCIADSGKYSLYQNRIKFKPKNIQQKYRDEDCWFCQKNTKFDKSLLVYRGKYSMVCLDKGPITQYHLQIIPLNHVDTLGKLQSVQVQQIQLIKNQLQRYFHQLNYQVVICQRYMRLSQQISHCLIQFIAVKYSKQLVQKFNQITQEQRLSFDRISLEKPWVRKSEYFIKFQIDEQVFVKQIYHKQKIDFDFMRKLVCELINQPSKINWRSCERSQNQLKNDREEVQNVLKKCHIMVS